MTDDRPILTPCPACQSEGRILTCNGGPDETDHGPCPHCDATGIALVPTEPITIDDLEDAHG